MPLPPAPRAGPRGARDRNRLNAFGLFFSSALAEEKSLEQLDKEGNRIWGAEGLRKEQVTRVVASGTKLLYCTKP
jgi:hypothetical protein